MRRVEFGAPMRTDRLVLRMLTASDVDDVHAYQGRADVCTYLLFEARSRDEVAERIARWSLATALERDGDYWQVAVVLPGDPDRVIGDLYFTIKNAEQSGGEIGWAFHPDFQHRGYAREAAAAILDRAFGDVGLHRVIAELDPRNTASARLCLSLGMRAEAFFVKDLMFRGAWADTGIYAILDEEWAARER